MTEHHDPHHHTPHTPDEVQHALHEHDDWFRHSADEPRHQVSHGDFNPYVVMTFLAVTAGTVLLVVVFMLPWFARLAHAGVVRVQEHNTGFIAEYTTKTATWHAELYGEPTWLNEKTNIVRIPIDDAMAQVVLRYQAAE